jgi:hypothetical protein
VSGPEQTEQRERPRTRRVAQARSGLRHNPTFVALTGFYVGMLLMIVIPSAFAAIITQVASTDGLTKYAPFALLPFAVPLVLLAPERTRRFGRYMLLGMVSTALVVGIVGGGVLLVLVRGG